MNSTALDLISPISSELSPKLSLPVMSHSIESILEISALISLESNKFNALTALIYSSFNTALTLHKSMHELTELTQCTASFNELSDLERRDIIEKYKWMLGTVQRNERRLTNLSEGTYSEIESFDNKFNFERIIRDGAFVALNARMGTGKTRHFAKPLCDVARQMGYTPIIIAHRVFLISELSIVTGTINYSRVKTGLHDKDALKYGMAICINSINDPNIKKIINRANGKYILFIDEYHQTILNFTAQTFSGAAAATAFESMKKLIGDAKTVIIADADMNDSSLRIANNERALSGKSLADVFFVNKDNSKINFNITLNHTRKNDIAEAQLEQIIAHLSSFKKAVFYSNRIDICYAAYNRIRDALPTCRILLICSETSTKKESKKFINDATNDAKNYDLIIISPTITSGVSVTDDDYTTAFSNIDSSSFTHLEAIQQAHRFRCVTQHNIVLGTMKNNNDAAIIPANLIANDIGYNESELDYKNPFEYLTTKINHLNHDSRASFPQFIISRISDLGYSVTINDEITDYMLTSPFSIKDFISKMKEEKINNIINAGRINYKEYQYISNLDYITDDDKFKAIHFEICRELNIPTSRNLDSDLIRMYGNGGRGVAVLRRNSILFNAIDSDFMDKNERIKMLPIYKRRFPLQFKETASSYINAIFGENVTIERLIDTENPLSFSNSTLKPFCDLVEKTAMSGVIRKVISSKRIKSHNRGKLKGTFTVIKISEKGRSQAAKDFLDKIGLKFKTAKRNRAGGEDEISYTIDREHLKIVHELLLWQSEKTEALKLKREELLSKRVNESNIKNQKINVELSELNDEQLHKLDTCINELMSEYDSAIMTYSCPLCYTPTNAYTCDVCGNHELINRIDIRALNVDVFRHEILQLYGDYILS